MPNTKSNRCERLEFPEFEQFQRMLKLANALHAMPSSERAATALRGIAELVRADVSGAWRGSAAELRCVAIIARFGESPAPTSVLSAGAKLLLSRPLTLSPVMHTHNDAACSIYEIRSACADGDAPSLLIVRRSDAPFSRRERSIVQLMHSQAEWCLHEPRASRAASTPAVTAVLAPSQKNVLDLMLGGLSEQQIADRLSRSAHTVHTHIKEIYRRYEVGSRAQLLAKFVRPPGRTTSVMAAIQNN